MPIFHQSNHFLYHSFLYQNLINHFWPNSNNFNLYFWYSQSNQHSAALFFADFWVVSWYYSCFGSSRNYGQLVGELTGQMTAVIYLKIPTKQLNPTWPASPSLSALIPLYSSLFLGNCASVSGVSILLSHFYPWISAYWLHFCSY